MSCKDRISELPDGIILHILSFLDAQDAVRSGILSKRFSYLWTDVPSLHFDGLSLRSVLDTLFFHKKYNLEKISIISCYDYDIDFDLKTDFKRLIRLLSLHNVKELHIGYDDWNVEFPRHFYSMSSLKKLTMVACTIETNGFVNWKSLKTLCLAYFSLYGSTIRDILSGCPSLELLELCDCYAFTQIDLTNHRCLRKLVIDSYDRNLVGDNAVLEIFAPNLQSLVLSGHMEWFKCKVLNAGSLIDCCLVFRHCFELLNRDNMITMVKSLLDDLSLAGSVTIGEWVLQILSIIELNGLPRPVSKSVTCLKLYSRLTTVDKAGIAWLLQGLYSLEKLFINTGKSSIHSWSTIPTIPGEYLVGHEDKSYWTSENMKNEFDLKLKTLEICGLVANQDLLNDQNEVLLLVEFLMKTARFLENVTISVSGSKYELQELSNKLLSFPRSSPHAVIKIIEL